MKRFLFISLLYFQSVYGDGPLENYFSYLDLLSQAKGSFREGEIEIVMDLAEIAKVQAVQQDRLLKRGFSLEEAQEYSRIGIVYEDQYWMWIRDAVYFPQGTPGTYDRLTWKSELRGDAPGVAILPVLPTGQIMLNVNFRHATRSWELEIPRGKLMPNETLEDGALREMKEETGLVATTVIYLGTIAPDSGVLSCVVPVLMGVISGREASNPEYSEAISDALAFTLDELRTGLMQGFLEVPVNGALKRVTLRDPFLTFALLQAQMRHLLNGSLERNPVPSGAGYTNRKK